MLVTNSQTFKQLPTNYNIKQNNTQIKQYKKTNFHILLSLFIILLLPYKCQSASATIASASSFVGISTNYTITIVNHSNPSTLRLQFSQWAPWQSLPYSSSSQYFINSGSFSNVVLSCRSRFANTIMQCILPTPTSFLGPIIQLIITNINNPSSTKPYSVTFVLMTSGSPDVSITSTLTVTSIRNTDITLANYTQTVGAISFTNWILSYDYYFDYNTILSIKFNNDQIKINFGSLSGVSAVPSNTTNLTGISTVMLSNWSDTSRGLRTVGFITVTNPNAAFNISASCLLYFLQPTNNSIIYQIQSYTITFSIIPANFTSISATNILQLGRISQIFAINNSICPLPSKNLSSTNVSYTDITYSNNSWANSTCTNTGIINSNNYCRYTSSSFPKQITTITQTIIQNASIPVTITQYTYFSQLNIYYPLCSQIYTIQLQSQQLVSTSILFDLSRCTTMKYTGQNNTNTVLVMRVNSAAVGDNVKVYGLLGVMNGMWLLVNNSFYNYIVTAADIINNTHISLPFSYNNPTYLTTNYISNITVSRLFGARQLIYANLISSNPPIPICPTTTPSIIQPSTLTPTNSQTYNSYSLSIKLISKFTDYSVSDYLKLQFKYYDNILFLNNINISPNIKASLNVNGVVSNCNLDVINDTVIHIFNISQINNNNAIAQIIVSNLVNPAAIYSIVNNTGFQVIVTTLNGQFDVQKQQTAFQYSIPTNQTTYAYTPLSLQTSQIKQLPILATQSSFSFTITNTNKPRFFSSMPQSTVTITLPFNCTQTYRNGSIRTNLIWQPFSNSINLNLTNCTIGYLTAYVAQMIINQLLPTNNATYSSIASYTAYKITLQCPDNCLICTSNRYCTLCINTTYSPYILLYNGQCYVTCPAKTYQPTNQSLCIDCHKSCQTCSGSLFTQCITCPQYYVSKQVNITNKQTSVQTLQNICVSICGDNMTFNAVLNRCQNCQIDCLYCIDVNYCYICKEGASIVGNSTCDFLVCTSPCQTCQGSMTNCTTCVNNMYLYQFQCYQQCPKNTYASKSAEGSLICQIITSPTLYFPATICSIVFIILVCICNACIDRGLTADKQRRQINMLTYASSILSYMQLFALLIMLAFTFNSSSIGLGIAGLFIWIICNIIFGIYYYKVMRVDQKVIVIIEKMSSKSRCIYYFVVVLSILVTLRTYRVLYCGLFRGVAPYPVKKKNNQQALVKIRKGSQGRIANQDINIKVQYNQQAKTKQQWKQNKDVEKQNEQIKISTQNRPNNGKNTSMSNKTVLKTIISHQINQLQPQAKIKITSQLKQPEKPKKKNTIQQLSQNSSLNSNATNSPQHSKFQLKRPYIIYLTIGSALGSILFLAAGINQIIKQAYFGMLFWGLDLLFVVIGSILCVCFDMWAGIKKSYLIALEKGGQANQTMQNLMMGQQVDEATQQKMLYNTKVTQKIGKNLVKKKSFDNQKQKKKAKKKYELPQSVKPKKSPKNKSPVMSPNQKQLKQKTQNLKKIKNRYSDLYKRSRKSDQQRESSNDHDDIPDIKVFQDIQMFTNDQIGKQPEKKIKKIKGDPKRMTSMQNIRRSQNRSVMNTTSNQALLKDAKLSWKMGDIFLGFKQDQNLDQQQDKKTEEVNDNKPQKQIYQFILKQNQTKQLHKNQNLSPKQVLSQKQRKQKKQEKKQSQNKVKPIQFQQ